MLRRACLRSLSLAFAAAGVCIATGAQVPQENQQLSQHMQPRSRLDIIRYISGEFARAVRPLPSGKKGFRFRAGQPVDEVALRQAVSNHGSAGNPGDNVQITRLEFKDKEIVLDINGGGKKRTPWRERIQISGGLGGSPTPTTTTTSSGGKQQGFQGNGSTLILDYGRPLPDLTVDELKQHLAVFLDFSKQRSASVQWVETLAPEFQLAIREKRAVAGMDRDMVVAAMGRPERKVRERDAEGLETEDWIYGHPPAKTVFVTFAGETVIRVKQFPQ